MPPVRPRRKGESGQPAVAKPGTVGRSITDLFLESQPNKANFYKNTAKIWLKPRPTLIFPNALPLGSHSGDRGLLEV